MKQYQHYTYGPRVHHLVNPLDGCVTLLVGDHHAMLVDTAFGLIDLPAVIRGITDLPLIVVNTHGHPDHALGNIQFDAVYLHPADNALLAAYSTEKWRSDLAHWGQAEDVLSPGFDRAQYVHSGTGNLLPLEDGQIFDLGGLTVETLHTPGHTTGSVCFHVHEERLLLTGDAMGSYLFLFLPESQPLSIYRQSLAKMADLDFDTMLAGHYYAPKPKSRIQQYIHCAEHARKDACKRIDIDLFPDDRPYHYVDNQPMEPSGYPDQNMKGHQDEVHASILLSDETFR